MSGRVFLADDERPVLDGVAAAIRKRLPDIAICGTATNGRDAVDGAIRERPDVILMDVRMPGMSGLEALRELRASVPETVPILLTAYERFDVAKEAFGLGVFEYLVKPVDQDLLVRAINGAMTASATRKAEAARARDAIEALEAQRPLLEEGLLYAALSGDNQGARIRAFAAALGLETTGCFAAFASAPTTTESASGIEGAELEERLRTALVYRLDCAVGAPLCNIVPVYFPSLNRDALVEVTTAVLAEADFSGIISGVGQVHPPEQAREAWGSALAELQSMQSAIPATLASGLEAACYGDGPAALALWSTMDADETLKVAAAGAMVWALRKDPAAVLEAAIDLKAGRSPQVAFESGSISSGYGARARALEALRYVEGHYADALSLEEMADRVGLSVAHLSRVLSAETGKSFTEHLTSIRIAHAKAALASGRLSVKEVGAAVGYLDPNYFSRAFKRETGQTPSEFARTVGKEG
ncbi:MAG TPA: response regulator [bacterium]|nr:response regulator [bacterium]